MYPINYHLIVNYDIKKYTTQVYKKHNNKKIK